MAVGIFLEREPPPARKEMEQMMGKRRDLFATLPSFLKENYQLKGELIYGGKNYGWNLLFCRGGKTLVNLFPQKGFFVAQVVLGKQQVETASALPLGKNVQEAFSHALQLHDGRWLFIPVRTKRDVVDIQALIRVKRKPASV